MILLSIPEEAALCRAAFAGVKVGAMVRHCHHERVIEPLTQPPEKRIAYILSFKPIEEQALRLHLFRPVRNAALDAAWATDKAALDAAWATYAAADKAAQATYNAAVKPAWTTRDAAVEPAQATYNAALKAAQATYNAAVEPAQATYNAAVEPAQATYNAALKAAHQAECPDCPWDGRTVFP
jgi:hypothetical protein